MTFYPQPDVLPIEVSMDGENFSNSGHEFGYYDPFIMDVEPRLIGKDGKTTVKVKGFGFVDTSDESELRTKFYN